MPRPKKDYKVLSIKLSTPIHDKLELFCEESGLSKTIAVEKLLDRFCVYTRQVGYRFG